MDGSGSSPSAGPVPLVRHLLLAEFDIDKGSVVRHQIPFPTSASESSLAESMLPEGGHLHETDWTIFFISNRQVPVPVDKAGLWLDEHSEIAAEATRVFPLQLQCQEEITEFIWHVHCFVMDPDDKLYGQINQDGALVQARFRVTKEASYQSPPQYSLDIETQDEELIRSILVTMELRYAFKDEDRFVVIDFDAECNCSISFQFGSQEDLLKFESIICKVVDSSAGNVFAWDAASDPGQDALLDPELERRCAHFKEMESSLLVCINLVRTRKVKSVRRGAIVKALAIVTSRRYVEMFRPLMAQALDVILMAANDEHVLTFLNELYVAFNAVQCPSVQASALHTRVIRGLCGFGIGCPYTACEMSISGHSYMLKMPIADVFEDELGGVSVLELIRIFGDAVMTIYNAVFLGRRILFLGHNLAASLVCRVVLAAAAMIRPLSAGILHRVFPYAHLTDLDFLKAPGFIAGVTNPIFANHWDWFDVLADVKLGTVHTKALASSGSSGTLANVSIGSTQASSAEKVPDPNSASHETIDAEMYAQMTSVGTATFGEDYTRAVFYDHTLSLLDQAASKELFRDDTRRRFTFDSNAARISEYRQAKHHDYHDILQKASQIHSLFGRHFLTIKTSVRLLQVRKLPSRQVHNIFEEITSRLITEEHVWQILDLLPECRSGLFPIASSLFGNQAVQEAAFELLERIESTGVGAKAIDQLPMMLLLAYRRLKREKLLMQQKEAVRIPEPIRSRGSIQRLRLHLSESIVEQTLTIPDTPNLTPVLPSVVGPIGTPSDLVISMARGDQSQEDLMAASVDTDPHVDSSDEEYGEDISSNPKQRVSDDSLYASSDVGFDD